MASHEMYAAGALSAVVAILLARWCLAGRSNRPRTAAASRRAARRATLRAVWRTGGAAQAGLGLPTDTPSAQRAVQAAEALVHGYWRRISPLYLPRHDHHQH
ncbi:hypothetical protein [Streptomyces sp. NBC_00199]|uniref:hypothetical protein n=1 Tax=Streptomyces sp. NBC_00199 TaxID=2975678 RepID=UPI00224FB209|nr:hypothetical protein [Streptomyces sp. NBC_00199]MCX5269514.1 hypothetical protein [Streptomyces sp. NBC_00199]